MVQRRARWAGPRFSGGHPDDAVSSVSVSEHQAKYVPPRIKRPMCPQTSRELSNSTPQEVIYVGRGLLKSWSGKFCINFKLRLVYRVAGAIGRPSGLQGSSFTKSDFISIRTS